MFQSTGPAIVLLGAVEAELGTITYVKGLVISLVGASACALLLCRGATRMSRLVGSFRRIAAWARAVAWWASGLSAGLLGLSMVLAIRLGELRMFGTSIPTYPMPYFYLVLVFWFMPRGNVVPTLLAMPIGVLFAGGAFVWVSNYLFFRCSVGPWSGFSSASNLIPIYRWDLSALTTLDNGQS